MLARIETPLKQIMEREGRSQAWLARSLSEKLGRTVHRQQVWTWLNGIHEPDDATKAAIIEALGREPSDLPTVFPTPEAKAA